MIDIELVVGNVYEIFHKRKGQFIGQLIDVVDGDSADPQFLTFKYDVRFGTDQIRLAVNPGKDKIRVSNIRPSLIIKLGELQEDHWLREVKLPEEIKPATLLDRILRRS